MSLKLRIPWSEHGWVGRSIRWSFEGKCSHPYRGCMRLRRHRVLPCSRPLVHQRGVCFAAFERSVRVVEMRTASFRVLKSQGIEPLCFALDWWSVSWAEKRVLVRGGGVVFASISIFSLDAVIHPFWLWSGIYLNTRAWSPIISTMSSSVIWQYSI